jgi:hypothetical protein
VVDIGKEGEEGGWVDEIGFALQYFYLILNFPNFRANS